MSSPDYKESQIIDWLNDDIKPQNLSKLYDRDYINYTGSPADNKNIFYSDLIAKYLIDRLYLFNNDQIKEIARKDYGNGHYIQEDHKQLGDEAKSLPYTTEDQFAKFLYNSELESLGKIIDFQTPIGDKSFGAVDLLAYNREEILSLVELKWKDSKETMLRAILEICTYFCQINKKQLEEELKKNGMSPNIKKTRKAVLVFEESPLFEHYKKTKLIDNLATKLEVEIFFLNGSTVKFKKQ